MDTIEILINLDLIKKSAQFIPLNYWLKCLTNHFKIILYSVTRSVKQVKDRLCDLQTAWIQMGGDICPWTALKQDT